MHTQSNCTRYVGRSEPKENTSTNTLACLQGAHGETYEKLGRGWRVWVEERMVVRTGIAFENARYNG